MNEVELIVELDSTPALAEPLRKFAIDILKYLKNDNWQMGLLLTDDSGIQEYNRQWRNIDKPTDVLSFVQDEGEAIPLVPGMPLEAGDVIISLDSVSRNAESWGNPLDLELRRVVIHGILHLMGMDHPGDDYETGMLKKQEEILAGTKQLMEENTTWPS